MTDTQYIVSWNITVDAPNPRAAAEEAKRIQRSYSNTDYLLFEVRTDDQDAADAQRIDLSVSAYQAAKEILIEACSRDMENTLMNDAKQRAVFAKEGFKGFGGMYDSELTQCAKDAGLDEGNAQVQWAIETLA